MAISFIRAGDHGIIIENLFSDDKLLNATTGEQVCENFTAPMLAKINAADAMTLTLRGITKVGSPVAVVEVRPKYAGNADYGAAIGRGTLDDAETIDIPITTIPLFGLQHIKIDLDAAASTLSAGVNTITLDASECRLKVSRKL